MVSDTSLRKLKLATIKYSTYFIGTVQRGEMAERSMSDGGYSSTLFGCFLKKIRTNFTRGFIMLKWGIS